MGFDALKIKKDFPIFKKNQETNPLTFLDSAASSQKPYQVLETMDRFYREEYANIHRGVYKLSQNATDLYEKVRVKTAAFIGAKCAKVILFTKNTTESINLVANTWGRVNISEGDEILLNELEHHSNLVPWQMLAQEKKARLRFIPLREDSSLDFTNLDELFSGKIKLVCVSQMSNVTGTIHDLQTLIRKAHDHGAVVLVDGAQGASHLKTNMRELDADFYAFSAHKMLGPTGVGVLYGKEEILEKIPPWMGGGDMILKVEKEFSTYADLPARLEPGTPNIAGVIGFSAALDYLNMVGLDDIHEHEVSLAKYAVDQLSKITHVKLFGTKDFNRRGGVVSFNIDQVHPHDVGSILDEMNIAIRVGHHCCQPFMKLKNIPGTCRASFYLYNTEEDVDRLIEGIQKVIQIFQKTNSKPKQREPLIAAGVTNAHQ